MRYLKIEIIDDYDRHMLIDDELNLYELVTNVYENQTMQDLKNTGMTQVLYRKNYEAGLLRHRN